MRFSSTKASKNLLLNMFASKCGLPYISESFSGIFTALRACVSLGQAGYGIALSLIDTILAGNTEVPDLVQVIPPGMLPYVSLIALLNEIKTAELFPHIMLPTEPLSEAEVVEKDEETKIIIEYGEKLPPAFSVYIEYNDPVYGNSATLIVLYVVETGEYKWRAFIAPPKAVEKAREIVYSRIAGKGTPHYDENPLEQAREVVLNSSVEDIKKGRVKLPEHVKATVVSEKKKRQGRGRSPIEPYESEPEGKNHEIGEDEY